MGGFAAGLAQGLESAQDRQFQAAQLKLQQDFAKAQQKQMETQDRMAQMNLHNLMRKVAFEQKMGGEMNNAIGSMPLGAGQEGPPSQFPVELDRGKIASFLQEAAVNGQDPNQLLQFMAMRDPRIYALAQEGKEPKYFNMAEGSQLVQVGGVPQQQPQAPKAPPAPQPMQAQAAPQEEPLRGIEHEFNMGTVEPVMGSTSMGREEFLAKEAQSKMPPLEDTPKASLRTPLGPLGTEVTGKTQEGRAIVKNPDGSVSTERSITVTDPRINNGQPTNIPSMFGGKEVSEEEAIARIAAAGGKDPETGRALPGFNSIEEAVAAAKARSHELGGQTQQPTVAPGARVIATNPKKEKPDGGSTHAMNATEAEVVGDFAATYPEKMALVQAVTGHIPTLSEIGQYFTPQEFAAVMKVKQLREEKSRMDVAKATGENAAKTAQQAKIDEPLMDKASDFFRFNPDTGLIDAVPDPMMSHSKAVQAGYRSIQSGQREHIERFNNIEFDLKQRIHRLKTVADAIVTSTGGTDAWKQGASLNFDALLRSGAMTSLKDENTGRNLTVGEATQLYKSLIDTIREPYARNVNGLKGPATERDIASAGAAFTALSETKSISAKKFQEIDDRLEDVKRSAIANLFGSQAVKPSKKKLNGGQADTDFLQALQPDARERYLKMSPDQQSRYKRAFNDQINKAVIGSN
jgi:hypothetical protein